MLFTSGTTEVPNIRKHKTPQPIPHL